MKKSPVSLRSLVLAFFLFSGLLARAQPRGLYVVDAATRVPVRQALLQIPETRFSAIADENGYLRLSDWPNASSTLLVSSVGYQSRRLPPDSLRGEGPFLVYLQPRVSSLEEVQVSTAAGRGIFKTISDLDIHLRPINNSQEVLRLVPGLFIGQHAGGGKAEQIFLRGFDLDHGTDISLSVDGMPVNMVSHAHGQGYADLHFLIPELIEEVRFDKGPYFADKGNFTTAGFVEFRTKDYLESNFIKTEGGQFNSFRAIAGINLLPPRGERRDQSLYAAGEASYTRGYFDSPQDFNRFNGLLKYHGSLGSRHSLTAAVTAFRSRWNASGQVPERAVESGAIGYYGAIDDTEGGDTYRYNANASLLSRLRNGGVLRNQVYYSRYGFELYSNFTFFKEDPINGDQIRQKEVRNIYGYNGSFQQSFYLGRTRTETRAGLQLRADAVNGLELTRTRDRQINTNGIMHGNVRELNTAAWWSQQFYFTPRLDLTAALRADHFNNRYDDLLTGQRLSTTSSIVSPKLNLGYRLNSRVQLYLYNGRGFHSNDTRVAVQQHGRRVLPPAYGSDLGGVFKLGKKLLLQSALWYLWLDQEFVYVGDEGVVEAGGQSRRMGIDLSARYEVLRFLFADVDLSLANPRALKVAKEESYLPLAPRFTSTGGLTYRQQSGWNGSLRYRYMANRPAREDYSLTARGYFLTDAALHYTQRKWEAGLTIQNLFNSRWMETQFDTESRLQNEAMPVSEIHFTPGTPFFGRLDFTFFF